MNKDEMKMIEENEHEMIKRLQSALPDAETMRFNFDKIDLATYLYDAGCRKVADDEIVIKQTDYVELNKDFYDWKKEYDHNCLLRLEVFELEKQLEKAKQETVREILQVLKDNIVNRIGSKYAVIDLTDIAQCAKELGIELED